MFGWFLGGFTGFWVVLLVCGSFGWFVDGSAGLRVISSFTANNIVQRVYERLHCQLENCEL